MQTVTFSVPRPSWVSHLYDYARVDTSSIVRVFAAEFTPDVTLRLDDDSLEMLFEGDCTSIKRSQLRGIRIDRAERVMGAVTFCTLRVVLEDPASGRFSYPLITCATEEVALFDTVVEQVRPVLCELGWDELSE